MYIYVCACIQSSQHNETCVSQMKKKQSRRSRIQATILSKFSNNSIQSIQEQLSKQPLEYFVQQQAFIYIQSYTIYIYVISIYLSIYFTYVCTKTQLSSAVRRDRYTSYSSFASPPLSALETVPEDQYEHLAEQLTKLRTSLLKQQQQKQKTEHTNNNNNKRNNNALQCSIATDEGGRAREAGS